MDTRVIRKWGPDVGEVFDPRLMGGTEEHCELILPELEYYDLGLELNKSQGHTFWNKGEMEQFHGVVRGVEVWIEVIRGRYAVNGVRGYRVAFGPHPEYPEQVDIWEAARLLKENIPPLEYVEVTPEEWAHRRD